MLMAACLSSHEVIVVDVTFITPYVEAHVGVLNRCVKSVRGQTVPSFHLWGLDKYRRGAGYTRNALLKRVTTPYVVFLDADDEVHPEFVERTLSVIAPDSYVYTGWSEEYRDVIPSPPHNIWRGSTWHVVTTLLPTDMVKKAGGFDPSLSALEDRDFYLRLIRDFCICPILLPEVLFTYHDNPDGRSKLKFRDPETHNKLFRIIEGRYSHKMACCGNLKTGDKTPVGVRKQGDVLVQPTWRGKVGYVGRASKRFYGRIAYPTTFWCDPADLVDKQLVLVAMQDYASPMEIPDEGVVIYSEDIDELDKMGLEMGLSPAPKEVDALSNPATPSTQTVAKRMRGK